MPSAADATERPRGAGRWSAASDTAGAVILRQHHRRKLSLPPVRALNIRVPGVGLCTRFAISGEEKSPALHPATLAATGGPPRRGKRGAFVQHLHQRRTLRLPALRWL